MAFYMCLSLNAILLLNIIIGTHQENSCGDWNAFENEKCFKLLNTVGTETYDEAIESCKKLNNDSTLASINSAEEQEWIKELVFVTHTTVDNVWIGGKRSAAKNTTFVWEDKSEFNYNDWFDVNVLQKIGNDCIELEPEVGYNLGSKAGKWTPVSCKKKNLALCQTYQKWSIPQIQKILSEFKNEMEDFVKNAHQNPVPINFTYVQLPHQPEPKTLWPTVVWSDISSQYAGQFFRVLGNNSSPFGIVQEENSSHLVNIESKRAPLDTMVNALNITVPQTDVWSNWIYTGSGDGNNYFIRFKSNGGEVRPRNQAIKVWQRIE